MVRYVTRLWGRSTHVLNFQGVIPRDGRNISFKELSTQIRSTYNFSPSFSLYVPRFIAHVLNRSYTSGRFDLADIDVHNGIEHDASLVRTCNNE
jgi:hypothetical protein